MKYYIALICFIFLYICLFIADNAFIDKFLNPFTIISYIIINVWYLFKFRMNNIFCFELLFSLSFFICSFLYPFISSQLSDFRANIFVEDANIQRKSFIIAFLGYLFYLLGLSLHKNPEKVSNQNWSFDDSYVFLANTLCSFLLVIFYLKGGSNLIDLYTRTYAEGESRLGEWGEFLIYAMYAYTVSFIIVFQAKKTRTDSFYSFLCSLPLHFYLNSAFLLIPLLVSGYRSNFAQLLIPMIMLYSMSIKRIKGIRLILLLLGGVVILQIIGFTRNGDELNTEQLETMDYLRDFIGPNGALSFLINYTDHHGITGGSNYLLSTLSFIPYLQSVALLFVDPANFAPSSSSFYTHTFDSASGLGTNIIGDLYYTFGPLGVVILMFVMGWFLRRLYHFRTPIGLAMLMVFSGNALFASRVEYTFIIRAVAWSGLLMWFCLYFLNFSNFHDHSLRNRQ